MWTQVYMRRQTQHVNVIQFLPSSASPCMGLGVWFSTPDLKCLIFNCQNLTYLFCLLVGRNRHIQLVIHQPILDTYLTKVWFACLLPVTEDRAWKNNWWRHLKTLNATRVITRNEIEVKGYFYIAFLCLMCYLATQNEKKVFLCTCSYVHMHKKIKTH